MIKLTLLFATLGLLAQLVILYSLGLLNIGLLESFYPQLITYLLALLITAVLSGFLVSIILKNRSVSRLMIGIVGIVVAESCLIIPVFVGAMVTYSWNPGSPNAFYSYVIKPVTTFVVFGCIPAAIFGLVYAERLRDRLIVQ